MAEPAAGPRPVPGRVKCVVWDLDNTLLSGVWLESGDGEPPPADPAMLAVLAELDSRGILSSVASRNPAGVAGRVRAAAAWPAEFAAPQYGWGRKSESLRRVAAELNIGVDALAFVDDDPYERAEVAAALPAVLVLAPEDVTDALGWPEFGPPVVTAEARRRAEVYAEARRRQQAAAGFGGSRAEFLRWCHTVVSISPAVVADLPRLHELSVRTHQFNSARRAVPEAVLRGWLDSPGHRLAVVRLADRFGDDGLVGAAVVSTDDGAVRTDAVDSAQWTVELLMMSCRAMGRGVVEALLAWLARSAAAAGAGALRLPVRLDERNVPLRLALVAAGFRADQPTADADGRTWFARPLTDPLPQPPDWATVDAP
jgi:FkbH-like protein